MQEIATLFARLGFQVDETGLRRFEKRLNEVGQEARRTANRYSDSMIKASERFDAVDRENHRKQMNRLREYRALAMKQIPRQVPTGGALGGIAAAASALYGVGTSMQSYQSYEGIQRALQAATGSAEQARKEYEWLDQTMNKLGTSIPDAAQSFASLTAATKGTALQGEQTRRIFEATASYARVLNLSMDDTRGVYRALSQMVSKGRINMEELRQQFGERLPGAMQAAARAMNMTTAELFKQVSLGNVTAEELLPKLSEELLTMAKAGGALGESMQTTSAALSRFKNSVWDANIVLNQSGLDQALGSLFDTSATAIKDATPFWEFLGALAIELGNALEAPIELFGTLASKMAWAVDESGELSGEFYRIAAAAIILFKPLRKLWAVLYLLPAAWAAINDIMVNGFDGWQDAAEKIGIISAAVFALMWQFRGLIKYARTAIRVVGKASGMKSMSTVEGATGKSVATQSKLSRVGSAASVLLLPELTDVGNAGNQWLDDSLGWWNDVNDFIGKINPVYGKFREYAGQLTHEQEHEANTPDWLKPAMEFIKANQVKAVDPDSLQGRLSAAGGVWKETWHETKETFTRANGSDVRNELNIAPALELLKSANKNLVAINSSVKGVTPTLNIQGFIGGNDRPFSLQHIVGDLGVNNFNMFNAADLNLDQLDKRDVQSPVNNTTTNNTTTTQTYNITNSYNIDGSSDPLEIKRQIEDHWDNKFNTVIRESASANPQTER